MTDGICEMGYELFAVVDAGNKSVRTIKKLNLEINAKVGRCKISGIEESNFTPKFIDCTKTFFNADDSDCYTFGMYVIKFSRNVSCSQPHI